MSNGNGATRAAEGVGGPDPTQDLVQQVVLLRHELAELREQLATEVRTKRIVVVDDAGRDRVSTIVAADFASFQVMYHDPNETEPHQAVLYAGVESSTVASVGVVSGGVQTATLEAEVSEWDGPNPFHERRHSGRVCAEDRSETRRNGIETGPHMVLDGEGLAQMRGGTVLAEASMVQRRSR